MKLTNTIRDAFISAAMSDVPRTDYDEEARKIAGAALDAAFKKAFPGVKIDRLTAGETGWLDKCGVNMPGDLGSLYTWTPSYRVLERDAETWAKLIELSQKAREQNDIRTSLTSKLKSVAYACTTRKALADALPEFEKYLPADQAAACRTLPAVANVVADFTKAGWPKGKKAA